MRRTGPGAVIVAVLVLGVTTTAVVGFSTPGLAATGPVSTGASQATPTNNTTAQHERPGAVSQAGDTQQVRQWLAGELGSRLEGSAIEISQAEYERGKAVLGDEYDSRLGQYVDVAGQTDDGTDDETAATFRETQDTQRAYAETVQSYQETYEAYQQAQATGNKTAAREHARELESLADRVETLNASLHRNYETLATQTGRELASGRAAISNTTREISAQQATVRDQTFVETALSVDTNGSAVAFDDPLAITGRITTANGSGVANQTVRIVVFERSYEVQTDRRGRFTVSYRPVSLPTNATSVAVRYVPTGTSPYLGTETTVSVDVTQVSPSLAVSVAPARAGYDDTVETTTVATVGGRVVPSLPVESTLGGVTTTGETDRTGQAILAQRVSATVPVGTDAIRVEHARAGRAIGPASTTAPVTITRTETALRVDAVPDTDSVTVSGRLTTADGASVADRSIRVAVGETVRSAVTNQTGWYRLTLTNVSVSDAATRSAVSVTARFDGDGTNLDTSRARTTVELSNASAGSESTIGSGSSMIGSLLGSLSAVRGLVGVGVLGVLILLGALAWIRRGGTTDAPSPTATDSPAPAPGSETGEPSQRWLARAQAALADGNAERAAITAYAAVRDRLQRRAGLSDSLTHREFLAACETQIEDVDSSTLSTVADAYERATFAATVDTDAATAAVEAAATVLAWDERSS